MDDTRQSDSDRLWYTRFHKQAGISVIFDDWHPDVFSKFDPAEWVDLIASTRADSCHVQAKDIWGNAYYVTEKDHQHICLRGRDAFGELVDGLHERGIKIYANIAILFDNLQYREHPDWRVRDAEGRDSKELALHGWTRTGIVCYNSPYREQTRAQLEAFGRKYHPDALLLDMIFAWIPVCYCRYCQAQYKVDAGSSLPAGDDRTSPAFRAYVRWRNTRIFDFAQEMISAFRAVRPETAVQINTPRPFLSTPPSPVKFADLMDYVGGDPVQEDPSPAAVVYAVSGYSNLKNGRPAVVAVGRFHGQEGQHTGMRSLDAMTVSGLLCAAHNCAYQLFDLCNADGTLYRSPFKAYKEVFDRLRPIEPLLGGEKIRHVAVYVSEDTKNFLFESRSMRETDEYVSEMKEMFRAFQDHHVPVDVITNLNLDRLGEYRLVCLVDMLCMRPEEADAFRAYVAGGGNLLATRFSSLADQDGAAQHNFALADLFGVDYLGATENAETYVAANPDLCREAGIPEDIEVKADTQAIVRAHPDTEVLGHMVLPYTNRKNDADRCVGGIGSPPGIRTDYPCIVLHRYGRGQSCYFSARFHTLNYLISVEEPRALAYALGRRLLGESNPLAVDAPPWVVVTGFRQTDRRRIMVHAVNAQPYEPILAVREVGVKLKLAAGERATRVTTQPDGEALGFTQAGDVVSFVIPTVHLYRGAAVSLGV